MKAKIDDVLVELLEKGVTSDDAEDVRRVVRAQEVQPGIKFCKIIMSHPAENIKRNKNKILERVHFQACVKVEP